MKYQKICIIGDGLSGLVTALALKQLDLNIDLFYKKKNTSKIIDTRTTAISRSNYNFLEKVITSKNKNLFWPCKKINLYNENKNELLNFLNFEDNNKNLMYIFKNEKLKKKIKSILIKNKNINFINEKISDINSSENSVRFKNKKISYDLIILCLGNDSQLYNTIVGGRSIFKNYKEIAITSVVKHQHKINNPSQYFLKEGPLAILPIDNNNFSLVWSLKNNYFFKNKFNLQLFVKNKLHQIFSHKFNINKIQYFPIKLNLKTKYSEKNILILGEGLHSIHPVAGQGFNLVLRDIEVLSNLIKENLELGMQIKNSLVLNNFKNLRKPENIIIGLGIDITNTFFTKHKLIEPLKSVLLKKISNNQILKNFSKDLSNKGLF